MEFMTPATALLGVLLCYLGYPVFRFSVLAVGLAGGAALGYFLGRGLIGTEIAAIGLSILGAILGTFLLRMFVRSGLFILGACTGAGVGLLLALKPGLILVAGVLGGLLVLFMSRWVLILGTSLAGALLIGQTASGIQGPHFVDSLSARNLIALVCWVTGAAAQVWLTRKHS